MAEAQKHHTGQIVPESGIYELTHAGHRGGTREVTLIKGDRFPPCRDCGGVEADYRAVRLAHHERA
jgi:hypothetical protein